MRAGVRADPPLLVRSRRSRLPRRRRARADQGPRAAGRRELPCATAPRCTRSTPAGRRSPREYDPKPVLMGETYVELPKLWRYAQQLDLVQNFAFLKAELDRRRAAADRRARSRRSSPRARSPVWFGSNHDHSRLATRWAGGDERKARAALFLLLTLRGTRMLYQGDELALARRRRSGRPDHRPRRPAARPRADADALDADAVPSGASRGCRSPTRAATSRTQQCRSREHAQLRARADRAAARVRGRAVRDAAERSRRLGLRARRRSLRRQPDRPSSPATRATPLEPWEAVILERLGRRETRGERVVSRSHRRISASELGCRRARRRAVARSRPPERPRRAGPRATCRRRGPCHSSATSNATSASAPSRTSRAIPIGSPSDERDEDVVVASRRAPAASRSDAAERRSSRPRTGATASEVRAGRRPPGRRRASAVPERPDRDPLTTSACIEPPTLQARARGGSSAALSNPSPP